MTWQVTQSRKARRWSPGLTRMPRGCYPDTNLSAAAPPETIPECHKLKGPCLVLRFLEADTTYEHLVAAVTKGEYCHVTCCVYGPGLSSAMITYDAYMGSPYSMGILRSRVDAAEPSWDNYAIPITEDEAHDMHSYLSTLANNKVPYNYSDLPLAMSGQVKPRPPKPLRAAVFSGTT